MLTASLRANLPETDQLAQLEQTRSTRLGEPDDIAAVVAFLLSDDASWINAQTIIVDGGLIRRR